MDGHLQHIIATSEIILPPSARSLADRLWMTLKA